jgi:hexosaminidase
MALGVAVLTLAAATAGGATRPSLMPWPASIESGPGELVIGPGFRITVVGKGGPIVESAARRLEARLARQTGLVLPSPVPVAEKGGLEIRCDAPGTALPQLGMDESYTLTVRTEGALLQAGEPWGVLRGMETFLQLVGTGSSSSFRVPAVVVRDRPRFPWRGLMLDCSRHFMPLDVVRRTLDGMAAVKLNAFHWHLTDDQGFRVESRVYPELHRMGSDGLFYTQEQVKEIVAYAGERGIRVYPEFDIPGHTTSWFVSHPELASMHGPYAIEREWGIMDPALDPSKEEVYRFLDGFLGEMAALFPDPYLHIGGDEVNGKHWDESARLVAFKKEKGFQDNHALLGYFSQRLSRIVTSHGKKMIGWDEILLPSLPKDSVIHSWRGQESLGAAAKQGYQGILSNGYYIDLMWPADRHYATDPWGKGVAEWPEAERARILGGEATMWSEFTPPELVDSRIWPRTAAIAERLWSPREVTDVDDMYARLEPTSQWLEWLGLDHRSSYRRMLERVAGTRADELRQLADVVEPLEDYQRGQTGRYNQLTAYVRLMDAARPESDEARRFARQVDSFLADPTRQAGREPIRKRLQEWQLLDSRLRSLLEGSQILREAVPLAAEASALATAGLEAVGFLEERAVAPERWWASRAPLLEREKLPATGLEVAYRPSIKRLMEAAAGR